MEYGKICPVPGNPNIHLIVGEDSYLVEEAARKLIESAVEPSLRATAVETIDGNASNEETEMASLRSCISSVQTPPFFDPVKLTWWRDVRFLPGGENKPGGQVKEALERFAANLAASPLPANQFLIVTAPRCLQGSVFLKTFSTFATLATFSTEKKAKDRAMSARMRLPELAESVGVSFAPGADEAFIAKVGSDTRTIISELEKLRSYLGPEKRAATQDDVAAISSAGGDEPEAWDLMDTIATRDSARILSSFAHFGDKDGIMLASMFEKYFRNLVVYRDALDHKWLTASGGWAKDLPDAVRKDLDAAGVGPGVERGSWLTRKGANQARAFTLNELRIARYRLIKARERLVSASEESGSALVLQELVRAVARPRRTTAAH